MISKKIFDFIHQDVSEDEKQKLVTSTGKLHSVNGQDVPIAEIAKVEVNIGKHKMVHLMVVVDLDSLDVLLGG